MRRRWFGFLAITCLVTMLVYAPIGAEAAKTPQGIIDQSAEVLRQMVIKCDVRNMGGLLREAKGIAIFPSVIKAGFIVGGRYGEGLVLRRDQANGGWFGPNFVTITGASFGFQIGVQSTALVLIIMNEQGMQGFTGGKFTLSGDLAATAGPVGHQKGKGTDFKSAIYSYAMGKGLFAGVSLEGAGIEGLPETNQKYWGAALTGDEIMQKKTDDGRVASLIKEIDVIMAK